MRDPAREALYCLIVLLAAVAAIRFGVLREERIGEHWTAIVPILLGLAAAPFALVPALATFLLTRPGSR